MFCFPDEQTVGCNSCKDNADACSKTADTAVLRDRLTGALIGIARATEGNAHMLSNSTATVVVEGLYATLPDGHFDNSALLTLLERADAEKRRLVPDCYQCTSPCGRTNNYDMANLWNADADVRSLKSLILFGSRDTAAKAYRAAMLGYKDEAVHNSLYKALFALGMDDWNMEELLPFVQEVGEAYLRCMALLDKADTEAFVQDTLSPGLHSIEAVITDFAKKTDLSPNVLKILMKKYGITPITNF